MFPSWPVSSPEPHASRPPAHSLPAPAGQHLPFPFTSHSGQPVNRKILFCSFGFPDAKTRGAYFFSIQNHRFRLDRPISANPLFIPAIQSPTRQFISFRRQPANTSRHHSFHTGPQSSTSQLPSSRLGRPTPYIPSNHFFNIYKAPSSHQVSLPTILPLIFLFLFFISPSTSFRSSPFRTYIPPLSQRPPLLPSCCRFSNPQAKRET